MSYGYGDHLDQPGEDSDRCRWCGRARCDCECLDDYEYEDLEGCEGEGDQDA